jgi:hypothetical protein
VVRNGRGRQVGIEQYIPTSWRINKIREQFKSKLSRISPLKISMKVRKAKMANLICELIKL